MSSSYRSRRSFLVSSATTAAAFGVPYYFSTPRTLADETKSKNDRFSLGLIGAGGMGLGNMKSAASYVDVVAIADVDSHRLEAANKTLSQGKADTYHDYRKILERKDIDVIHIATPDHWHTKPLIEAMLAGKDVYCEKPLTLTVDEGKLIRKIQKQTGRIVQVGTQQRSTFNLFTKAIAMVQQGRLGKIKLITVAIGGAPTSKELPITPVPSELNWDRWLGPAPKTDYRVLKAIESDSNKKNDKKKDARPPTNAHYEFRWWYEYSGGKLTDWGAHHVDIASWALHMNGQTADPLSIGGTAKHPVEFKDGVPMQRDRYNTATEFRFNVQYPGGTELVIRNEAKELGFDNGVMIEGEKGTIFVNRGKLTGAPVDALKDAPLPEDAIQKAYKSLPMEESERKGHWACFLNCVKSRKEPISDVHSHMKMLNICHLAGISARLGRSVNWDGASEQIVGDDLANSMLARPYRTGYEIEM